MDAYFEFSKTCNANNLYFRVWDLPSLRRAGDYDEEIWLDDWKSLVESEILIKELHGKSYKKPVPNSQDRIKEITSSITALLLEKNNRYGDAAINPKRRFSKLDSTQGILIRLDDKMNRIETSETMRTNDVCDLIGYLTLLLVAKGVTGSEIMDLID